MTAIATLASLVVTIGADTNRLLRGLDAARAGMSKFAQRMESTRVGSETLTRAVTKLGIVAGAALGALGIASLKASSDMEQSRIAFTTLLGDAEKAQTFLADLAQFAARTPFELRGLQDSSKKLLAYGFQIERIIPMMTNLGDATAGLGLGNEGIDRLTRALGQMQAKGKVSAEEMMQIAETGIPAWQFLADAAGKSIAKMMKLSEQGALGADFAITAILQGMNDKFSGLMALQSNTIGGAWSNMLDGMYVATVAIGDQIAEAFPVKQALQDAGQALTDFAATIKRAGIAEALDRLIPDHLEAAIFAVAGAITVAMIPALWGMAVAGWAALAPLLPLLAAGAAIGALAYVIFKAWNPVAAFFVALWQTIVASFRSSYYSLEVGLQELQVGLAAALDFMLGGVSRFVSSLLESFGWLKNIPGVGWLVDLIQDSADSVAKTTESFKKTAAGNLDWAKNAMQKSLGEQTEAWEELKGAAVDAGHAIADTVMGVINSARGLNDLANAAETAAEGTDKARESAEAYNREAGKSGGRDGLVEITNARLVAARQAFESAWASGNKGKAAAALAAIDLTKLLPPDAIAMPAMAAAATAAASQAATQSVPPPFSPAASFAASAPAVIGQERGVQRLPGDAFETAPRTSRVEVTGKVTVEGVNNQGELVGVAEIVGESLGREVQRDQDRFTTRESSRRIFR